MTTLSTDLKTMKASVSESGKTQTFFLSKREVDNIYEARKERQPFVYLQGDEYPTNRVRLHKIKPEDRTAGVLRWTQDGLAGRRIEVEGKQYCVWKFTVWDRVNNEDKEVDSYEGYYDEKTNLIKL